MMNSEQKAESEIEIRSLNRDELKVVWDNCNKQGWDDALELMQMMYDALSSKRYKLFGAVDKNGEILSKYTFVILDC